MVMVVDAGRITIWMWVYRLLSIHSFRFVSTTKLKFLINYLFRFWSQQRSQTVIHQNPSVSSVAGRRHSYLCVHDIHSILYLCVVLRDDDEEEEKKNVKNELVTHAITKIQRSEVWCVWHTLAIPSQAYQMGFYTFYNWWSRPSK